MASSPSSLHELSCTAWRKTPKTHLSFPLHCLSLIRPVVSSPPTVPCLPMGLTPHYYPFSQLILLNLSCCCCFFNQKYSYTFNVSQYVSSFFYLSLDVSNTCLHCNPLKWLLFLSTSHTKSRFFQLPIKSFQIFVFIQQLLLHNSINIY